MKTHPCEKESAFWPNAVGARSKAEILQETNRTDQVALAKERSFFLQPYSCYFAAFVIAIPAFLRFYRPWTGACTYLITSHTRIKRVSQIHHRTGPQSPFSISSSFIILFLRFTPILSQKQNQIPAWPFFCFMFSITTGGWPCRKIQRSSSECPWIFSNLKGRKRKGPGQSDQWNFQNSHLLMVISCFLLNFLFLVGAYFDFRFFFNQSGFFSSNVLIRIALISFQEGRVVWATNN